MALALHACVQGNNYQRPQTEAPASWSRLAPIATTVTSERGPEATWWKTFQNDELSELIEQALQHNHDVKRAVARIVEGRASVMSATAGLFPHFNLSSSYTNIAVSENTLAGLGLATGQRPGSSIFATPGKTFDLWNGAMDLRWEIDFWGRIRRGREAAQAETKAIEEDARAVALSLISEVGQSCLRIRELPQPFTIATLTLRIPQPPL